jgi:Ca2+-binding RTX toxin-like protein
VIGGSGNDELTGDALANRFEGGDGDDFMLGGGAADILIGGAGLDTASYTDKTLAVVVALAGNVSAAVSVGGVVEDTIVQIENVYGGTAADTLTGDSQANVLRGFGGADVLDGAGGSDTADYFDKGGAAIFVTLNGSTAVTVTVGGVVEDSIVNIENIFGAAGNDSLTGDGLANRFDGFNGDDLLIGAGGNDVLVGGFGNDTIRGGLGNDQLIGDAGIDTADFSDLTTKITTTLRVGAVATVYSNGVAQDTMIGFENLTGGSGDDELRGDENANVLSGNGGKDTLFGEDGADTLSGGTENDTLGGGAGNDTLFGDAGIDKLYGDAGDDNLSGGTENDELYGGTGNDALSGGAGDDLLGGGADNDTLTGDAGADKLYGDDGEDNLSGGTESDELSGGKGNDVLSGGEGDDTISGDEGADQIDGGAGVDRAEYWLATGDLSVTLDGANNALVIIGGAFDDLLKNIESVVSGSGNDTLSGDANTNLLQGNDGNDILNGAGGYDFLFGVEGNDVLNPGSGGGQADGGNGVDTLDMSGETLDLVATLTGATASTVTSGGATYARIKNIENLIGGTGNDTLTGDGLANALSGGDGNDVLSGKGGADALDGGAGRDRADYSEKNVGVQVILNGATFADVIVNGFIEDTIRNVEDVTGGSANDNLDGDGFDNGFDGGGGADILSGRLGDDTLTGGAGNDTLYGDEGVDTAIYSEKTAAVFVFLAGGEAATVTVGGVAEDTIQAIENIVSGSGDDVLVGDAEDNRLDGGVGNDALSGEGGGDTLIGGDGFDTMDGGDGSDTADYSAEAQDLIVDLDGANFVNVADGGGTPIDLIRNIENFIGGSGNDLVIGDDANNRIEGRDGEDGLAGGAGDDVLKGGAGNDSLDGEGGNDTADFSDKTESVSGATGDISFIFIGATEVDTIYNIENLIGGSAADSLVGDARDNRFQGLGGADSIDGGAGNDTADYSEDTFGVFVDMTPGGVLTVEIGGTPSDTIQNIESIIGGAAGDFLFGDGQANMFFGNGASDQLSGGGGNDWIRGGEGVDGIDGGTGSDTLDYGDKTQAVVVTLNGSTIAFSSVGGVTEDVITNMENIIGGSAGDTLTGDATDNRFKGMGGADILDGGVGFDVADFSDKTERVIAILGGSSPTLVSVGLAVEDQIVNFEGLTGGSANDILTGDAANNLLEGGGGDDVLTGLGGNDTIDGGAGRDQVDYSAQAGEVNLALDGATQVFAVVGGVIKDALRNIENVLGGLSNDVLVGDLLDNSLSGRAGGDVLQGEGGQDSLLGDAGDDTVKGGEGFDYLDGGLDVDTADYSEKTVSVEVTLDGGNVVQALVGGVSEDQILNVENLAGGSAGDTFAGDGLNNRFDGNDGDDTLLGGGGGDLLLGGAGSDFLHGGVGQDTLDGGADFDFVEYRYDTLNIVVTLNGSTNATVTIGGVAEDSIRNIEGLLSGSGNDLLVGDGLGNVFYGENGDDTISGAGGADGLNGGFGNDVLTGGLAADNLDGGDGIDTASYAEKTAAVVVTLNGVSVVNVTVGGVVEDTLVAVENVMGGSGNDALTGDLLANALNGGAGNDILSGSGGDDTLTGGLGADQMTGGSGNDTFFVDNVLDTAIDGLNGGLDTVSSSVSFTIGANIEVLILTGVAVAGTGNASNNTINGNNGANTLNGGDGNDTLNGGLGADAMTGGAGNDIYVVDNAGDTATEAAAGGTDTVQASVNFTLGAEIERLTLTGTGNIAGIGNGLDNLILGNSGGNVLDGLAGADTMRGGAGNDIYRIDNAADVVTELLNEGIDRIDTEVAILNLVANVENLTLLGTLNIDGGGNNLSNTILGNSGNNQLDGKGGADTLRGLGGDDTYFVDDALDVVIEAGGQGTDTVRSLVSFTMFGEIENLVLTGAGNIDGTGNSLANSITGNLGNNVINGGAGADAMAGGAGNDTYVVDNIGDTITELSGANDVIQSSVTYTMAAGIEGMTLTGTAAINGTGNTGNNSIAGNLGANTLSGGSGNDTLNGDAGADILIGGLGLDTLTGGLGVDRFRFENATSGADTVADFAAGDLIELTGAGFAGLAAGALAAARFVSGLAPTATLAAAQILYDTDDGFVLFDSDGTGAAAAVRIATLTGAPVLTNTAFVVI